MWCEEVQLMERERFRRTQDSLDPDPGQMANQVREGIPCLRVKLG